MLRVLGGTIGPDYNVTAMDRADAVVIGGGVMGTSIAYHLARRHFGRIILVEKATVCSGTSAKSSAVIRTHYTTRPTAIMALLARRMMETFREDVGNECGFVRTGMLVIGAADSHESMAQTVAMNREVGIETSFVSREEAQRIDPLLDPPEGVPIVYEPRSGYGSPHEVAQSYARRFVELAGVLRQGAEVTALDFAGGRVGGVRSTRGDIALPARS